MPILSRLIYTSFGQYNVISDIWIIGASIVHWAHEGAKRLNRANLHLDHLNVNVKWNGTSGMRWHQLPSTIQWIGLHPTPKIIIVHLGGNNVVPTLMQHMKRMMRRDFSRLFQLFPHTLIVWSEILPRLSWKYARPGTTLEAMDTKRKRFNCLGRQMVRDHMNGRILKHDITADCPGLFGRDGCHLSDIGIALFCNSIQGAVETFTSSEVKIFGP